MVLLRVNIASDMFSAVVKRFEVVPWSQNPTQSFYDVRGGPEVYEWMSKVFLPQLYASDPTEHLQDGFCTDKYPCLLGEGNAHDDTECARYLRKGEHNCPSYLDADSNCCEPCVGPTCEKLKVKLEGSWHECPGQTTTTTTTKSTTTSTTTTSLTGPLGPTTTIAAGQSGSGECMEMDTSVPNVAENCKNPLPSWLPYLLDWPPQVERLVGNAVIGLNSTPPLEPMKFCPERIGRTPQDPNVDPPIAPRALTVAGFNHVLMGRITMKRIKLLDSTSSNFKTAYPQYQAARQITAFEKTSYDDTKSFGVTELYEYKENDGFMNAGGFIQELDFSGPQTSVRRQIDTLRKNNWFDLNQGSFVFEMLVFNGNYEIFMHVAFVFEHDFNGGSDQYIIVNPLNMAFINSATGLEFWIRYLALGIMIIGFFGFLKNELDDMSADPVAYFTNLFAVIHFASLALSLTAIILWCALVYSYPFRSAQLPFSSDIIEKGQELKDIVGLAVLAKTFSDVIAINLCLIIVRCIILLANMTPFFHVIVKAIVVARHDLLAFVSVFMILFTGFVFAGFFLFGARLPQFQTFVKAMITCLKMVMGDSMFTDIDKGEPTLGQAYFFVFHLTFIIIKNILLSVICLAYYKSRKHLDDPSAADKFPLKRFLRQMKAVVQDWSRIIGRCLGTVYQFLFGSGGGSAIRVNYDQVNHYQDKRSSYRPKRRSVQYESKQDEFASDVREPDEDLTLEAKKPLYRDGMMNYYVKTLVKEGNAGEAGVKENWRLVAIQKQGESDPMRFRDPEVFNAEAGKPITTGAQTRLTGYGGDPDKILKFDEGHPPITLVFEGWVEPVSFACIGNLIFAIVFSLFLVWSMRISQAYYLTEVQEMLIQRPHWWDYNPIRLKNFSTIEDLSGLQRWYTYTILPHQYGCITSPDKPGACKDPDMTRTNWSLYLGPQGSDYAGPVNGMGFQPTAVDGMSIGYVPWSGKPVTGDSSWQTTMPSVPRIQTWNVGFMANNFVRNTLQVSCFNTNKNSKWNQGVPYVVNHIIQESSVGCAQSSCMTEMIDDVKLAGTACLDANGRSRDPKVMTGTWSGVEYRYSKTGTFRELGGISIGLGGTRQEAEDVLEILGRDQLLSGSFVNSVVLEYVTYNEQLDLFIYNTVEFSVMATGRMLSDWKSIVFPLNVFSTGQSKSVSGSRVHNYALWLTLLVCVVIFTLVFLRDVYMEYRITSELQKPIWSFIPSFFAESWWNVYDLIAVLLCLGSQYFLMRYVWIDWTYDDWGWSSWTVKHFKFNTNSNEGKKDEFLNFSRAAFYFDNWCFFASWGVLFIIVRTVKYMNAIPQLRIVVLTISTAVWELLAMLLILFFALFGFACMFFVRYGYRVDRFGNLFSSFAELFIFMCGDFRTSDLFHESPVFFAIAFPFVQLIFYFVLANMFLAAIVYKWREIRKTAQEDVVSTLKSCWKALSKKKMSASSNLGSMGMDMGGEKTNDKRVPLDPAFWQGASILNYLPMFDENGMIRGLDKENGAAIGKTGKDGEGADGGQESEAVATMEMTPVHNLENIFKKAHMELASQMCRHVAVEPNQDDGAGLAGLLDGAKTEDHNKQADEGATEKNRAPGGIVEGIIEDEVLESTAKQIKTELRNALRREDHSGAGSGTTSVAQEIWLDSLVTVLEDVGALQQVQDFFLPPPRIQPRTNQDWVKFEEDKTKLELRLDKFLRLLLELSKRAHYLYLKDSAKTKEKVLKQQSLVFADYLDRLEDRIKELQQEIKVLERKNTDMRSHVAPLL